MHIKRVSLAKTIFLSTAAAGLALFSGCTAVTLSNLTPSTLPENPSQIYTFTLRATSAMSSSVDQGSISPRIVVDGKSYPMKPSSLGDGLFEFDYQLPAGRSEVAYYYLVGYQIHGTGGDSPAETYTETTHAQIVHRYVLSLEANRGPAGAKISVLGRGFTPEDTVSFNDTPVRTAYASPTALSFFVPAMPPGRNYRVSLGNSAGNSPIGTFRIDPTTLSVNPSSLALHSGERQTLSFTVTNPAPAGGLLLDVTTDVPESVIMPEVVVPEGQTGVTVTVEGGKPGTGNLVLKGVGDDVTIPITVSGM